VPMAAARRKVPNLRGKITLLIRDANALADELAHTSSRTSEILEGLAVCESPWRRVHRIAPGALCCRSGSPPIPAETGRKYSNYSLARLWLILAGPMASAINNLSALAQKRAEVT
jgi:hypothetical protein